MTLFRGGLFPRLVALFPVLFPLYLFRGAPFGVPVTLPEVVLLFMALYFVIREELWRPNWWAKRGQEWLLWPVILFVLAAVFGVFVAPESSRMAALGILKGWILAPLLYFVMARFYFREKPSLIPMALKALLFGGSVLAVHALWQVISGDFITVDLRASGPFESANYLALYLGPLLVYGILELFKVKDWGNRIYLAICTLLCALGLYFTYSYAAYLAVSGALVLAFVLDFKRWSWKARLGALFGLGLLGVLILWLQIDTAKFAQFIDFEGRSSTTVRLQVYEIASGLLKEHWLLGHGLGLFEEKYLQSATRILGHEPFEWVMLHPHNIFLAMWLNLGLLGLGAFAYLLWQAFAWFKESSTKMQRVVLYMLLALLLHGLVDTPYFKNDLAFEFWLMMAILL